MKKECQDSIIRWENGKIITANKYWNILYQASHSCVEHFITFRRNHYSLNQVSLTYSIIPEKCIKM